MTGIEFPMSQRRVLSNVGRHVYAVSGIAIGLVGLVWGDFDGIWQPIQTMGELSHRTALAYLTAACFLLAGMASLWRVTVRTGLALLTMLFLGTALLWLPRVIGFPGIFGTWAGFGEQFCVACAGLIAYLSVAPSSSLSHHRVIQAARVLFGICVVMLGFEHFTALSQTADMVPAWIPPSQRFWAIATGVFHLLAGTAIVTGIQGKLAAQLETAMIGLFGLLVWAPSLAAAPHSHTVWAGNAVNLSLAAAAWVVADNFAETTT